MTERTFAEVDKDGNVLRVIVCEDDDFLKSLGGEWVETFKDASDKKNYAGIGYTFDKTRAAFISPKPRPDAVLNEQTCTWTTASKTDPIEIGGNIST